MPSSRICFLMQERQQYILQGFLFLKGRALSNPADPHRENTWEVKLSGLIFSIIFDIHPASFLFLKLNNKI